MNGPMQILTAEIDLLAEQLVESEGMRLIDVECARGPKGRVIQIFIDKPGGVTIDDCAMISRRLGDTLDAKIPSDGPYHLEVSSPGLERPLTKPKHFVYFQGRAVVIRTHREVEGEMHLRGILAGLEGDVVKLEVGGRLVAIPYETIAKARLDAKS
jgi:ribosome maturation factor RimP